MIRAGGDCAGGRPSALPCRRRRCRDHGHAERQREVLERGDDARHASRPRSAGRARPARAGGSRRRRPAAGWVPRDGSPRSAGAGSAALVCGVGAAQQERAPGRSARCARAPDAAADWRADRRSSSPPWASQVPSTSRRTSWILTPLLAVGGIVPGERRLHGHQPAEQVLLVVLEADVEHVGLAALGDVARDLQRHRGLARALRAADEHQLAAADAAAEGSSSGEKPSGMGWYSATAPRLTLSDSPSRTSIALRGCRATAGVASGPVGSNQRRY